LHHAGSLSDGPGDCSGFDLLIRARRPALSYGLAGPRIFRPAAPTSSFIVDRRIQDTRFFTYSSARNASGWAGRQQRSAPRTTRRAALGQRIGARCTGRIDAKRANSRRGPQPMTTPARSRALCWLACCSPTGYGGRYSWAFTVYLSVVEAIGSLCCAAGGVELPASCAAGLPQSTRAP